MTNKILKISLAVFVVVMSILVIGCQDSSFPIEPGIAEVHIEAKTSTPTSTSELIVLTKTATLIPTIQTATKNPASTATGIPTLNANEIEKIIFDLLRSNGECSLPCFWGIQPKVTSFQTAKQFFHHLGRKGYSFTNENGNIYQYSTSFGVNAEQGYVNIELILGIESDTITSLEVYIGDFKNVDPNIWQTYSLQSILQTLGIPSEVRFLVEEPHTPDSDYVSYAYILIYDDPDVIVFYVMGAIDVGATYEICPLNPKDNPSYMWLFLGKDYSDDFSAWVELTEATSMTHEDFYDLFVDGTMETCLKLNAEAFKNKP